MNTMFLLINKAWLIVILFIYSGSCDDIDENQFSIGDPPDNSGWVDPTNPLTYDIGTQTNFVFGDTKSHESDIKCPECKCDQSEVIDSTKCDITEERLSQCEKKYQSLQKRFESTSCDILGYQILRRTIFMMNDIFHRKKVNSQHLVVLPSNLNEFIGNLSKITEKLEKSLDCHCLHDFDRVISGFLNSLYFKTERMEYASQSFGNWKPSHEFIYTGLVLASILVLLSILYMFGGSRIPFALILVFICCFSWEWLRLYQTEVAKQRHILETSHRECSKSQKSWYHHLGSYIKGSYSFEDGSACENYYITSYVDAAYQVTPGRVIVETLNRFIMYPLEVFGDSFGVATRKFFAHIPQLWILPFFLVGSITLILVIWVSCHTYHNRSAHINIAHSSRNHPKVVNINYINKPQPERIKGAKETGRERKTIDHGNTSVRKRKNLLTRCCSAGNLPELTL